eukprot:TRINITY_DN8967_c0_g1_i1.p1 TRINITY_DN8967_c0_g1~~TRINITY_DN8967_c0_g1_i1.p1  ORF type:complete len:170 (+),score=38.28 TRINITY_DN8967_c0_g1_i1:98-607(+)
MSKVFEQTDCYSEYIRLVNSNEEIDLDILSNIIENLIEQNKIQMLYEAPIKKGNIQIIEQLIYCGVDMNVLTDLEETSLYLSVKLEEKEIVKLLVNKNADIDKPDNFGWTPLFLAAEKGHLDIVKLLVENRADVNKKNWYNLSPLILAQNKKNNDDVVKYLIEHNANID